MNQTIAALCLVGAALLCSCAPTDEDFRGADGGAGIDGSREFHGGDTEPDFRGFDGGCPASPPISFEPVVESKPPPPISGGTLLVASDLNMAVAADPDRDRISLVNLSTREVRNLALEPGDEPGRVARGSGRLAHVALRGGGAIVTVDMVAGTQLSRRSVCPAPRGLVFESATGLLHVACAGGELVSLPEGGATPTRALVLEPDLRDVMVDPRGGLLVSRFRSAELLSVTTNGVVSQRRVPASLDFAPQFGTPSRPFVPAVAWRTILLPSGVVAMLHQRADSSEIDLSPAVVCGQSAYGSSAASDSGCKGSSIVQATVSLLAAGSTPPALREIAGTLPVDLAMSEDGRQLAVAFAASESVVVSDVSAITNASPKDVCNPLRQAQIAGTPIAVAFNAGYVVIQTREPAALFLGMSGVDAIRLNGESREHSGHKFFHRDSGARLACASCHPEGREDGRTWRFKGMGARRTQALGGGISDTEPFHWTGDQPTFDHLVSEVFVGRMGGGQPSPEQVTSLKKWLDTIPVAPAPPRDTATVARGKAVFAEPTAGCAACHAGVKMTNNQTVDVGTGQAFQVPSLRGLGARAPYLHDGCATTVRARFGECGGGARHGNISGLGPAQLDDLVAYLESL